MSYPKHTQGELERYDRLLEAKRATLAVARTLATGEFVEVRDEVEDPWRGPFPFEVLRNPGASDYPIVVREGTSLSIFSHCRRYVPAVNVTFQPWYGGERPVEPDVLVLYRLRGGGKEVRLRPAGVLIWTHGHNDINDIVEWCALRIVP